MVWKKVFFFFFFFFFLIYVYELEMKRKEDKTKTIYIKIYKYLTRKSWRVELILYKEEEEDRKSTKERGDFTLLAQSLLKKN